MTDIGIVGLDTSHGEAFAEVLESRTGAEGRPDPTVTAVWDGGTVRDEAYVERFCEEFGAARYEDPADVVDVVDAAMVLTVDWERHVPLARLFLDAGVPTLVDKPIAGHLAALQTLADAASAAPLFGGSALPYHPSFAALADGSQDRTLHLAGYHDHFYYRVHVVDTVRQIVNADWSEVCAIAETETSSVSVSFADGTWGTLRFDGPTGEAAFATLDVSDRTRTAEVGASEAALREMYEPYLDAFLRVVHGVDGPPTASVVDAGRLLLAIEAALAHDRPVTPGAAVLERIERPSASFLADYEPYY
jgi:predicted dehydrogenase